MSSSTQSFLQTFSSEDADGRARLVFDLLDGTRDRFTHILDAAATYSIDPDSFSRGVDLALERNGANLPALRLLSWQKVRREEWAPAKAALATLAETWPAVPGVRRELLRAEILSPGPDGPAILEGAASEFHNPLARISHECQFKVARSEPLPARRIEDMKLYLDQVLASLVRGGVDGSNEVPKSARPVLFAVLRRLLAADSIALVGNGPSLTGRGLGEAIDGHEVVVRFNYPKLRGFAADVGQKTDVVFFSESLVNRLPELTRDSGFAECLALAFHPEPDLLYSPEVYAANMSSRAIRIPPLLRSFYRSFFYNRPTTGLMGIILIAALLRKKVALFGFDFYSDKSAPHYFPSNSPVFLGHELRYEQWFLETFLPKLGLGEIGGP